MTSDELRLKLIDVLKQKFPSVRYREIIRKSGGIRVSPYVPNKRRNKRWMQIDSNPEYLAVAMDHFKGDITLEDVNILSLAEELNGMNSAAKITDNDDAVNFSFFISELYDFNNENFSTFLHKHYHSYLKRIDEF